MKYEDLFINDFGGLNEDENPHVVADNELTFCRNVWKRGRTIGTRPGTQRESGGIYDADIAGTPQILGIHDFRRNRDMDRDLVVMTADNVYENDTTAITKTGVEISGSGQDRWTFANHNGVLYAAGGDVGAGTPDEPWYWSGSGGLTKLSIPNLSATDVSPRWIHLWENYLWAGGFEDSDGSAGGGIVRYSALNDPQTWPVGNSLGGFSAVGGFSAGGDEYLTGMNSYQDNDGRWGLILSSRRIYAIQQQANSLAPFRITDEIANGCVSHHAFVNLGLDGGDGIYLSEHGIHSLRQSQQFGSREDKFLSFKIRKTFRTINRSQLPNAVGAYWRELGLVLFAVATGANTRNNMIFALDVRDVVSGSAIAPNADVSSDNARWYIWELGDDEDHACSFLHSGKDSTGRWRIYGGNYKGQVFEFTEDLFSDMGEGYAPIFRTKHFTFEKPMDMKVSGNVLVDLQPGGSYKPKMKVLFDFGSRASRPYDLMMPKVESLWGPTGSFMWGENWSEGDVNKQTKVYATGFGDSIGYEFQHTGVNEPFYVSRLSAHVAHAGAAGTDS